MLNIENLDKQYSSQTILKNISFSLNDGNIYGFVGENGAGKSTLFRCIAGLEKYQGNIQHTIYKPLKNILGFLNTEPYFPPRITAEEYIHFCCYARNIKVTDLEKNNLFDLPLKKYAQNYSTGMKKKLALWTMLLQKNEYFILDEPFNGVDLASNIQIREILLWLKSKGKTLLISSHILSTLTDVCDEIFYLHNGSIQQSLLPNEYEKLQNIFNAKKTDIENQLNRIYQ